MLGQGDVRSASRSFDDLPVLGDGDVIALETPSDLGGRLKQAGLSDVLQLLELARRSARVEVEPVGAPRGVVVVVGGRVRHARHGALRGEAAFFSLIALRAGSFRVRYDVDVDDDDAHLDMDAPLGGLLLDALRQLDERGDDLVGDVVPPEDEAPIAAPPRKRGAVPALQAWTLIALVLVLGCVVGLAVEEPLLGTRAQAHRFEQQRESLTLAQLRIQRLEREAASLREAQAALSVERDALLDEKQRLAEERAREEELARAISAELKGSGVGVKSRDGGVLLTLQSEALFSTGAHQLNARGEEALSRVARALASVRDRRVRIEGHTDDVPTGKDSSFPSNWELSSARALSVRAFLEQNGVDPARTSAEARGWYAPVASNASERGRARNRRIEIYVVAP